MQKTRIVGAASLVVLTGVLFTPVLNARQTRSTGIPSASDRYPAQTNSRSSSSGSVGMPDLSKDDPANPMHERMEEQAAKARSTDRFKRIQSDTDKLLKLSTELKEDVDKSTKNEMSMDVIRKAAEVEKLAHDVKDLMKG